MKRFNEVTKEEYLEFLSFLNGEFTYTPMYIADRTNVYNMDGVMIAYREMPPFEKFYISEVK